MKTARNVPLLTAICWVVLVGLVFAQQSEPKPPFTLEITANGGPYDWDFANTTERVVTAGLPVEVAVRKTNRSNQEIFKRSEVGDRVGYQIEVRDSDGNLLQPKPRDPNEPMGGGGPISVTGSKDMILQPGESHVERDFLSGHPFLGGYDLSRPGKYTVQGWSTLRMIPIPLLSNPT